MRISPVFNQNYYNTSFSALNSTRNVKGICDYTLYNDIFRVAPDEYPLEYTKRNAHGALISQPAILLQELQSYKRGYGKNAIKHVVRHSMVNPKTQGRVLLRAKCIDGQTNPSGFYYKLGFRFTDERKNEILEKWLRHGGIRSNSPKVEGDMFLPKKNIYHCLHY